MIFFGDLTPVKFYPYATTVMDRFIEIGYSTSRTMCPDVHEIRDRLHKLFTSAGIENGRDNKIAFEVEYKGQKIFYGFYDNKFSVGLRVHNYG